MKNVLRSRRVGLMLFAFFALSALVARDAYAQAQSPAPGRCGYNQLSLRHEDENAAMGGLRNMQFIFTNTSSSPCTLKGYPRFELLNRSGRPARGGRASNGLSLMGDDYKKPPQDVTIEPGKTAIFLVGYHARGAGSMGGACPGYRKFRVTAPGIRRAFVQSNESAVEVCYGLEVSPVLAPSDE